MGVRIIFADLLRLTGDRMIQTTCTECDAPTRISSVRDDQHLTADYHCPECGADGSLTLRESEIRLDGAVRLSHLLRRGDSARHDFP